MRRSGRLRQKKRVDYNVDRAFKRIAEKAGLTEAEVYGDPVRNVRRREQRAPRRQNGDRVPRAPRRPRQQRAAPVDPGQADWERTQLAIWASVLGLESPDARVRKIQARGRPDGAAPTVTIGRAHISGKRRHLLFMNPGDKPLRQAMEALHYGRPMPAWTKNLRNHLRLDSGQLQWHEEGYPPLPLWTKEEKRDNVKLLYFDPVKPSTILPITEALRSRAANVSKKNVTNILRSLKQYQLTFRRRMPQSITEKTLYRSPGVIAADTFYPSSVEPYNWHGKFAVLTIMDVWSRFVRCYVCADKRAETVGKGIRAFLQEFASISPVPPRRMMIDKGSELAAAQPLMEEYRQEKDRDRPLVLRSVTGKPVNIVEGMNAQVQRRMMIYRTVTDDPSLILDDICVALNNQPRPSKKNLTPLELLALTRRQREEVNAGLEDTLLKPAPGLKALSIGSTVRVLLMTRKEQEQKKLKGFAPKWSETEYTVLRRRRMRRNPSMMKYDLGLTDWYYRHELLKIPKITDDEVFDMIPADRRQNIVTTGEDWADEAWVPSDPDDVRDDYDDRDDEKQGEVFA